MPKNDLTAELLAGHRAGWYDVPDELLAAVHAHEKAQQALAVLPKPPGELAAHHEVVNRLVLDYQADKAPELDVSPILNARRDEEAWVVRVETMRTVVSELGSEVHSTLAATTQTLITVHLTNALHEVLDEVSELHAKHGANLTAPAEQILGSGKAVVDAWRRIRELAPRYTGIREIHARLVRPQLSLDGSDFLSWWDDPREPYLFGANPGAKYATNSRPWPTGDPIAYLIWVATSDVHPWVPTAGQVEHRWRQCYGHKDLLGPNPVPYRPAAA